MQYVIHKIIIINRPRKSHCGASLFNITNPLMFFYQSMHSACCRWWRLTCWLLRWPLVLTILIGTATDDMSKHSANIPSHITHTTLIFLMIRITLSASPLLIVWMRLSWRQRLICPFGLLFACRQAIIWPAGGLPVEASNRMCWLRCRRSIDDNELILWRFMRAYDITRFSQFQIVFVEKIFPHKRIRHTLHELIT
jgi:hypothetical protein